MYITEDDTYVKEYFDRREVKTKKAELQKREEKIKELRATYPDKDDSFIESMLIAYMTDSAIIGGMVGGNMSGAIIGDMLNDSSSNEVSETPQEVNNNENTYEGSSFS